MRKTTFTLSVLGGWLWISLPFFPPACVPVTEITEGFCNRLWTPALAGMFIGAVGLFELLKPLSTKALRLGLNGIQVGYGLMVIGNFAEYWIFFGLPHEGPNGWLRGLLWMSVLLGWLIALLGSVIAGISLFRSPCNQKWQSLLFLLPLPLTIVLRIPGPSWAGIPLGLLGILIGGFGLALQQKDNR